MTLKKLLKDVNSQEHEWETTEMEASPHHVGTRNTLDRSTNRRVRPYPPTPLPFPLPECNIYTHTSTLNPHPNLLLLTGVWPIFQRSWETQEKDLYMLTLENLLIKWPTPHFTSIVNKLLPDFKLISFKVIHS